MSIVKELKNDRYGNRQMLCECACGNQKAVALSKLTSGNTKSCGCFKSDLRTQENTIHGMAGSNLYKVWASMKQRCSNPHDKSFNDYGSRGIKVCRQWLDFKAFYKWAIANGYQKGLTLERLDNNGDYDPSNCTWVPKAKQSGNRRNSRMISFHGETKTLSEWSRCLGLNREMLKYRLNQGWDVEKAFTIPSMKNKEVIR